MSRKYLLSGEMPQLAAPPKAAAPAACRRRGGHAGADGVMERGIGQADVALAVEADAVQLQLQMVVAVARGVEHHARGLVDLDERR